MTPVDGTTTGGAIGRHSMPERRKLLPDSANYYGHQTDTEFCLKIKAPATRWNCWRIWLRGPETTDS